MARSDNWAEWDGRGLPHDEAVLFRYGWTGETDGLEDALVVAGWMDRRQARAFVEPSVLHVGWYGYRPGETVPEACTVDGECLVGDGGFVEVTLRMTWVAI